MTFRGPEEARRMEDVCRDGSLNLPWVSEPIDGRRARPADGPTRRHTVSSDPDVLRVYERLVVAREGIREFGLGCDESGPADWHAAAVMAEDLVDQAQRLIEGLR